MKVRLGALGTIERHLKLNPHDTRALYFGAQNLVRVGDTAKAIELAERALRQDQNEPIVLYNIACFYAGQDDVGRAVELLEKAVRMGGGDGDGRAPKDAKIGREQDGPHDIKRA